MQDKMLRLPRLHVEIIKCFYIIEKVCFFIPEHPFVFERNLPVVAEAMGIPLSFLKLDSNFTELCLLCSNWLPTIHICISNLRTFS